MAGLGHAGAEGSQVVVSWPMQGGGLAGIPECKRGGTGSALWRGGGHSTAVGRCRRQTSATPRPASPPAISQPYQSNAHALPRPPAITTPSTLLTSMTAAPALSGTLPIRTTAPHASALQLLFESYRQPPTSSHPDHLYNLALQIAHNLRHQHLWTDVRVYTHSPTTSLALPRPLISGLPPVRLYVHPDEQIALLQKQKDAGKTGMPELRSEREWVLPSHLREKWSLKRFGEVFDAITLVPTTGSGQLLFEEDKDEADVEENEWRKTKRLLLATLDDDSTVVYYIVHNGIVKPRQN